MWVESLLGGGRFPNPLATLVCYFHILPIRHHRLWEGLTDFQQWGEYMVFGDASAAAAAIILLIRLIE